MAGGLLQLVAYGAQDAYITGNPQITFFKGLFKRHTNFAMEAFRVNFNGQAGWGTKHSAILGRNADLLYSTYLEVVLAPGVYNYAGGNTGSGAGFNLIKYVELDIGGQIIDRQYGEWMYLWSELSLPIDAKYALVSMTTVGSASSTTNQMTVISSTQCGGGGQPGLPNTMYIPLGFWFTRNPGAALPLIALQYHEVKINLLWNTAQLIAGDFNQASSLADPIQAAIYCDYIFLDTEERRRMAQQSHEYLIEQTQFNEDKGITSYMNRIDLTFNHPVKELVWVVQPSAYTNCQSAKNGSYYAVGGAGRTQAQNIPVLLPFTYDKAAVYEQWLQINGQDRMAKRYGDYYSKVQPFQHHTGSFIFSSGLFNGNGSGGGMYCYSFALRPEEHQPSGTCNFSRIDTATLVLNMSGDVRVDQGTDNNWDVRVYALSYNILRVMSGMGGLAYSN